MENSYTKLMFDIKGGFLILGLTGFTGSGCTTAAGILSRKTKPVITLTDPTANENSDPYRNELARLTSARLTYYWANITWAQFKTIEISKIIFSIFLLDIIKKKKHNSIIAKLIKDSDSTTLEALDALNLLICDEKITESNAESLIEALDISTRLYRQYQGQYKSTPKPSKNQHNNLSAFILHLQEMGDNIRKFGAGTPTKNQKQSPNNLLIIPEAVRRTIKCFNKAKNTSHFVIDAFRNPYEVEYFKRRYSEFYLIGLNRNKEDRLNTLYQSLSHDFIVNELEPRETGKKYLNTKEKLSSQNILECLRKSDIYIDNITNKNGKSLFHLEYQLARLVVLTKFPGCIPPSEDERNMQIAMTARQASGCISRHVGAIVTDKKGFVVGIGWNDPPVGQIPCSLRTADNLEKDPNSKIFSFYEKQDNFKEKLFFNYANNKNKPFCFREQLTTITNIKSAEMTRALHAEENAFLQANRTTGEILSGGTLYTTDRTCNLCAKKAYQLQIKRIVYVEDYTDIAVDQTINAGFKEPKIERFQGILGSAYFKLFSPLMPEKDLQELDKEQ